MSQEPQRRQTPVRYKILVTEGQRHIFYSAYRQLVIKAGTRSLAHAVHLASSEYLTFLPPPRLEGTCSGPRRPLRFGLYWDQLNMVRLALSTAKEAGCTNGGWAIAEVCASVFLPGAACNELNEVAGGSFPPGSTRSGYGGDGES